MPTPEEQRIIAQFEAEMNDAYSEPLKPPHRYNGGYYRRLLDLYGAVGTAIYLIDREDVPYGLENLYRIGMLHRSVEAIILRPEYRISDMPSTPERCEKARRRLWDNFNGYRAPWDDGQ